MTWRYDNSCWRRRNLRRRVSPSDEERIQVLSTRAGVINREHPLFLHTQTRGVWREFGRRRDDRIEGFGARAGVVYREHPFFFGA